MPKFSKKVMGKEVGDASVYAPPHTMDGKPLKIKETTGAQEMANMNISVDGIVDQVDSEIRVILIST